MSFLFLNKQASGQACPRSYQGDAQGYASTLRDMPRLYRGNGTKDLVGWPRPRCAHRIYHVYNIST